MNEIEMDVPLALLGVLLTIHCVAWRMTPRAHTSRGSLFPDIEGLGCKKAVAGRASVILGQLTLNRPQSGCPKVRFINSAVEPALAYEVAGVTRC